MSLWDFITDASIQRPPRVWLTRTNDDESWKPLRHDDCSALNASPRTTVVYIDGGRSIANIAENYLQSNFGRGAKHPLASAVWFQRKIVDSKKEKIELRPVLNADDAQKIEAFYQKACECTDIEPILLSDQSTVNLVQNKTTKHWRLQQLPPSKGWFSSLPALDLQRGYGDYQVDGEAEEAILLPVRHAVFIVHGIGEALFARDDISIPSLMDQTHILRRAIQKRQVQQWKRQCQAHLSKGLPPPPVPHRIEVIPIEWYQQLHDKNTALMRSVQATTLPTIPALRDIANHVVLDVLLYLTPTWCQAVLQNVTQQLQDLCRMLPQAYPDLQHYSLMGHSLGSVICWDLLALLKQSQAKESSAESLALANTDHEPTAASYAPQSGTWGPNLVKPLQQVLPFTPHSVIFLGSPLGLFLTLRGVQAEKRISDFSLPVTRGLYNIFHPSDPVAYRIEPVLVSPTEEDIEVPPPVYVTSPGQEVRLHLKAKQWTDDLRKSLTAVRTTQCSTTEWVFPLGGTSPRVDHVLQTGVLDNEYLSAILAHSTNTYFQHEDLQEFLVHVMGVH